MDFPYIWLSFSLHLALDEEYLKVHCQFGGIDQRFDDPFSIVTIYGLTNELGKFSFSPKIFYLDLAMLHARI